MKNISNLSRFGIKENKKEKTINTIKTKSNERK